ASGRRSGGGALAALALVLIAAGFVAAVMLANNAFKSARADLTDGGLFTLSEGTLNVIQAIDEPITLRFYFSDRLAREIPQIGIYGQRVQDMLEEFAARGKGKIRLEIYDPLPFTDVEDRAVAAGLKGVPVDQTGETVYFGLALALTFPIWITVNVLGEPDNGVILASYVGSFLMAGGYLAIGSCLSATTKNQVIAFVLTVTVAFLFTAGGAGFLTDLVAEYVSKGTLDAIAGLSVLPHFNQIVKGMLALKDIAYFAALIVAWLLATMVVVDYKKAG
ncbi:MAG: GldG family protein, partial [Alphaproteobacteria bacterium]